MGPFDRQPYDPEWRDRQPIWHGMGWFVCAVAVSTMITGLVLWVIWR